MHLPASICEYANQMEANLVKMRPLCFYSAVMENLKLDCSVVQNGRQAGRQAKYLQCT